MPRNRQLSIEQARKLAAQWDGMAEDNAEHQRLSSRFADIGPSQVIDMWESGLNEKGKALNKFEAQALGERWCEIFGSLPPAPGASVAPRPSVQAMPADDTMLDINEVARLTGISKSTINRHVQDGTFPKPFKISARRNGYLAREVKEWLERLDEQRHATRN